MQDTIGNPRYLNAPTPVDSIVVIRAAIAVIMHLTQNPPGAENEVP